MKPTIFRGSGIAIVTPFKNDGSIDFDALRVLLEQQIGGGTDAIIICGTTGEASTMDDAEHLSVIECAVNTVNGRIPVIAGTGTNDTHHCVELSKNACALGVDAILVVTPYYNKTSQKGLIKHFSTIADAVDKPIMLYNVPARTNLNITPETCAQLCKHPNINSIKEASGLLDQVAMIRSLCGDELNIYAGNDDIIVPILSLGGYGVVSVIANMMPKETHDICALWDNGDYAASRELFIKLMPIMKTLFTDVSPMPIKYCMNKMGLPAGICRMPLVEVDDKVAAALDVRMAELGLI